jgi:uncharacterized membrane protein
MKKEQISGIIRHTLTFVGGLLVMKGLVDESTLEALVSGLITITGLVWSILEKNK